MTCDPPGYLQRNTVYTVNVPAGAVQNADQLGNAMSPTISSSVLFSFQTIDTDLIPPVFHGISTGAPPFAHSAGVSDFSREAVLSLSFSETVQAGAGSLVVDDCFPGDP